MVPQARCTGSLDEPMLSGNGYGLTPELFGQSSTFVGLLIRQLSNWRRAVDKALGMSAGCLVLIRRSPKMGAAGPPDDPSNKSSLKRNLPPQLTIPAKE